MNFDWSFFAHLLFHPPGSFVQGAIRTVYLAVIAQALGVPSACCSRCGAAAATCRCACSPAATSGSSGARRCWSRP